MHFYGLSFQENDAYVKQISPLSHEFPRTPHGNPHRTPYLLSAMISCYHFLPATFSKGAAFGSQPPSRPNVLLKKWGQRKGKLCSRFKEKIKFGDPRRRLWRRRRQFSASATFSCRFSFSRHCLFAAFGIFLYFLILLIFSRCFFANKQQCSRHLNNTKRLWWRDEERCLGLTWRSFLGSLCSLIHSTVAVVSISVRTFAPPLFASVVCCLTKQINKL